MIGYYAHHQGVGHVNRASAIASAVDHPMTLLSTSASAADAFADRIPLHSDVEADDAGREPTANGALHYAPMHARGLQVRMNQITGWIRKARPDAMIVDVSVEVALLARLCGVPVIAMAMPGERSDDAHQLGHRVATRVIAPWARSVYDPIWLRAVGSRVEYVGSFSRFARRRAPAPTWPPRRITIMCGAGGTTFGPQHLDQLKAAVSRRWPTSSGGQDVEFTAVGGNAVWSDDVWGILCSADLVLSHGGQNAVAEIAAARRPAILVAERRPHGEQEHTVRALARAGIVQQYADWTSVAGRVDEWKAGETSWDQWAPDDALSRTAGVIDAVAAGRW